jgi:hypothetical protein
MTETPNEPHGLMSRGMRAQSQVFGSMPSLPVHKVCRVVHRMGVLHRSMAQWLEHHVRQPHDGGQYQSFNEYHNVLTPFPLCSRLHCEHEWSMTIS